MSRLPGGFGKAVAFGPGYDIMKKTQKSGEASCIQELMWKSQIFAICAVPSATDTAVPCDG